ncbi:MAG: hypothetical protein JST84_20205 [Acidobacteria bacterium]|nr:hypothetical protein [Acidobacteriota bacterium]
MPVIYLGRTIFSPEEFAADQAAGLVNLRATYEDYLAMIREQVAIKREAEEAARRDGYELGAPELDLSPKFLTASGNKSAPKKLLTVNDCHVLFKL